ncbi:MAG: ribosome biogenesis GTP-binding protein YihA/YsxC [Vampirovibrio sp.]|nr:ribosome biogenesis GTP-binding protein YihA/YsxC [Vampirovibrio sp.]
MKIKSAEFIKSAPSIKDAPELDGQAEFVLVGRSNVGKSSFINCLLNRKNLAKTSNTPGKTRLINYYQVIADPTPFILVDLPGYGYAKVSKTEQQKWQKNLEAFLKERETIRQVFQLIDARHPVQDSDFQMWEWLNHVGLSTTIVLTKGDKIKANQLSRQHQEASNELSIVKELIIPFSANTGLGKDKALASIQQVLNR